MSTIRVRPLACLSLLAWLLLCPSCGSHSPVGPPAGQTITVNVDTTSVLQVSQLVDSFQVVRLESPPDHLIGEVAKICVTPDHHFYILDKITNQIDVFDSLGRFRFDINRYGFGSGRCKSISDMAIDPSNNTLAVIDPFQSKLLRLDLQGNLIKEYPIVAITSVVKFAFLGGGDIVLSRGRPPDLDKLQYSLQVTTGDLKFKKKLLKYIEPGNDALSAVYPFQRSEGQTFFLPVYSDVIDRIDTGGAYPMYRLDFGSYWMTPGFVERESQADDVHRIGNDLPLSGFVYFVNYCVTLSDILIYYSYKGVPCLTFYDRETKRAVNTRISKDLSALGFTAGNSNVLDDSLYIAYISDVGRLGDLHDKKYAARFRYLAVDSSRQNPVILLTKFKKNL